MELVDLLAARKEAVRSAREILAARVLSGEVLNGQIFEIADESGDVVAIVSFRSTIAII